MASNRAIIATWVAMNVAADGAGALPCKGVIL
jgi:hypothetical protein